MVSAVGQQGMCPGKGVGTRIRPFLTILGSHPEVILSQIDASLRGKKGLKSSRDNSEGTNQSGEGGIRIYPY